MLWLPLLALAGGGPAWAPDTGTTPEPSAHTVIYYNARMALREGDPIEAVKLWYLRSALEDQTETVSAHDADLHSVTWAALGELGVCQDGLQKDKDGAGLWPLAVHNHVVRSMGRRGRGAKTQPYAAFDVDRQQRNVAIGDVLDAEELATLRLSRGFCVEPRLALVRAGELPNASLSDRQVVARLLRFLLVEARGTLHGERVVGQSTIDARLFDLDLQLTALAEREARRLALTQASQARQLGLGRDSVTAVREEAPLTTLDPTSEAARILRESVHWPVSEWMALEAGRRAFLFDHARTHGGDPAALDATALGILDQLIRAGEGKEAQVWIARVGEPTDAAAREQVWGGARGQHLLALGPETGFGEASPVALARGVQHLERGELPDALRSFAFAVQHAASSQDAEGVEGLSLRWLSYVAGRFEITDDLLITLRQLVPTRDYAVILEDLMWRSALRADTRSFERGLANQPGRGALSRRLTLLTPLAEGNVGRFATRVEQGLVDSPSETLRFLDKLIQRLELEPTAVRAAHLQTLDLLEPLLLPLALDAEGGRASRTAGSLLDRAQAQREGLGGLGPDATPAERARGLDPEREVFVGSVRLAPSDPLPWPFRRMDAPAPSVFSPLDLIPVEWRDPAGELVFGWSLEG